MFSQVDFSGWDGLNGVASGYPPTVTRRLASLN